jgi:hypothetical protein
MILGGGYSWPPATAEALLAHAKGRASWRKLTPLQQRRAEELFLTAESPSLLIITADNVALQKKLGWSSGQAQDLVRALKNARLLTSNGASGDEERGKEALQHGYTPKQTLLEHPSFLSEGLSAQTHACAAFSPRPMYAKTR